MSRRAEILAQAAAAKPRLRGWLHLVAAPIAGLATIVLALAAPPHLRVAAVVFAVTTVLLFAVSAVYHRGRFGWGRAPRWLFVPMYLALGWASVMFLPGFLASPMLSGASAVLVLGLVVLGGVLYTLGAVVFATTWPNPSPRWFGFHEVFHSFTVGGWLSHYVAAALVVAAAT